MYKFFGTIIFLVGVALNFHHAVAQDAIIISQPNSPIEINKYGALYSSYDEDIKHTVEVKNTSGKRIVAYRLAFQSFNVFNEHMGRGFNGVSIQPLFPDETDTGTWSHRPYATFMFESYGTAVSYVSDVRFTDGTVWKFNRKIVLEELQKIQKNLTEDIFKIEPRQ